MVWGLKNQRGKEVDSTLSLFPLFEGSIETKSTGVQVGHKFYPKP